MVAVDPETFKVKSIVQLPQMIGGRNTATQYQGKDYTYLAGSTNVYRYIWNGSALAPDPKWGPVPYLLPSQTSATAPVIMGNWVIVLTNGGAPSNKSLSVVAISQADPNKLARINPIPLQPGQQSFIPSTLSVDLPNNRIYVMDYLPGKVAAVNLNQATGNMSVAWGPVDERTISFLTLIGPADKRVFVATNINPNATQQQLEQGAMGTATYTEQILWRDASTGKVLATSDYFPAMSPGILVTPGYGGLIYDMLYNGHILALQVAPVIASATTPNLVVIV